MMHARAVLVRFWGSGTSSKNTLNIIGEPGTVSSRTVKGQGGSAASLRTTLDSVEEAGARIAVYGYAWVQANIKLLTQ